ncbi:hypothetical protein ACHBTE_00520 [Streptomyces sp. M41]|uniref:hypothetical protein n=1 Tax=Streptomyces sp. M41 TaxID=3059412 RepID=UPI00374D1D37
MSAREAARRRAIVTQNTVLGAEFSVEEVVAMGRTPRKGMLDRDAVSCRDRVAVMSEGRLVAVGVPAEVLTPGLVHDVFGVRAVLGTHPITDRPRIAVASSTHRPLRHQSN